jgi:hypothetical protein
MERQVIIEDNQAMESPRYSGNRSESMVVKGFTNSSYGERSIRALTATKARAPVLGGTFGAWGGLYSTFHCGVQGVRKEDTYNASMWVQDTSSNYSLTQLELLLVS